MTEGRSRSGPAPVAGGRAEDGGGRPPPKAEAGPASLGGWAGLQGAGPGVVRVSAS